MQTGRSASARRSAIACAGRQTTAETLRDHFTAQHGEPTLGRVLFSERVALTQIETARHDQLDDATAEQALAGAQEMRGMHMGEDQGLAAEIQSRIEQAD